MPLVTVRGADRGQSSSIEIYSDKKIQQLMTHTNFQFV